MRFQIASDLHLEMLTRFPAYRVIEPAPEADALLLAGDIHEHTHAIEAFADWPVPVLYVHGNHEPFNAHYWGLVKEISRVSAGVGVHYLERRSVILGDVRILGSCLWTDYTLAGDRFSVMNQARRIMPEHQLVRTRRQGYFGPEEAYLEFQRTRAWLETELDKEFEGKTVVMTHHAPHPGSISPKYAQDPLSGAFASDLSALMPKVDLWVHGHLHENSDFRVGRCRVLANPRGYASNRQYAESTSELVWENPQFNPKMVIEV
jgi:predicted phosphodiesterase